MACVLTAMIVRNYYLKKIEKISQEDDSNDDINQDEYEPWEPWNEPTIRAVPRDITDETYNRCFDLMRQFVLCNIELKEMHIRERRIVESLIYEKLMQLPDDPHATKEAWFWGANLNEFTKRMKAQHIRIYERLQFIAERNMVPDWVKWRIYNLA